jgi:hypothetical protein
MTAPRYFGFRSQGSRRQDRGAGVAVHIARGGGSEIELHSDGERFITARNLPNKYIPEPMCVILNWFDELKAKVPVLPR